MEALDTNTTGMGEVAVVSRQFTREENYWLNKLSGKLVKSAFPYDFPKARESKPVMESVKFRFSGKIFSLLMKLCKDSDPKLYMVLITSLVVLLDKYTGNKDIIVGTPIFKQETEAGFINTVLALRNPVTDDITFKELLLQVRGTIIEADENQNYSIEMLLQKLEIPYSGHDFPLFDTALLLENIHYKKYLSDIPLNLIFSFSRGAEYTEGEVEYNAFLYKKTTVERIIKHFTRVLEGALQQIDLEIGSIAILSEQEKNQLLVEFNNTETAYPPDKTIHRLFEEQVEKTPYNRAIYFEDREAQKTRSFSYKQLNRKANRLARILRKNGISSEAVVGIMTERSLDMVVGLLAILKAGGAYLPIDPGTPQERVQHMLRNSSARTLLTDSETQEAIPFTVLRDFEENKDIRIEISPPRVPIKDFDSLPVPDRSLIDLGKYKNKIGMASVTNCISLQTTRGCPYECLYCHKIWSKKHVFRSAENIYGEIEYFYKNGVSNFAVIDDCFNLSSRESRRLFQKIIKNKLQVQIFFPNGLRGDIMTPGYIDLMVEAGTCGINLSLESASPRLQKLLKKNLDLNKFRQVVDYIATAHPGIILEMATMHGFPSETEDEAMMTLDFIKDSKWLHFPYIHILKIFPNTEMEAFALEQGISKEDIMKSRDRAFHELPETLPFPKSFTRKYQANFLNEYFLSKERLQQVLPVQMRILSEEALAQKYNAYLPTEIKGIRDVIEFAGLEGIEVPGDHNCEGESDAIFAGSVEVREIKPGARRILFLDLSQHFSSYQMLYRVVEQPLGENYLLTYLEQRFGKKIDGRIYKSGNDFDCFEELRELILDYKPELIGIRTLTFFKEFFHETAALIRQWGIDVPVITGGPYASSDYDTIIKDKNIDLVVIGEGEYTLGELIEEMLDNGFKLPGPDVLERINGIVYVTDFPVQDKSRQVILPDKIADKIAEEDSHNLESVAGSHSLAYVMYTSGSTGKPKGVMVEHRQVNNCIYWMQEKFQLGKEDVIVQRTNLTFDPSVWEIFWPLAVGGSVKLLNRQQSRDAEYLIKLMAEDSSLSMMYCPATLVTGMTYLLNRKVEKPLLKLPRLIIGAEPIQMDVVKSFYAFYKGNIVNTYGPTECTINNTYYDLDRDNNRAIVPIGKPIANNKIYILSPDLRLLPVNVAGEIYIAGSSVARGYINNREQTEASFIENPYGDGKLYRSGDIGRWLEDGTIEIMGRTDDQVKIRGYRIELGEIRTALLGHKSIADCVVVIKDSQESQDIIRSCKRCGITSKYPGITINEDGICGICRDFLTYKVTLDAYFKTLAHLEQAIKDANKEKTGIYDCLLLYSGGRGAAYALYRLVEMGFKVLAATYDNGYMGKANMKNIKVITSSLDVDHIVLTNKNTERILAESIKTAHTVCRGCFLTSSSLAAEYALQNNIKVVVGATLSRGQIIDNKLFMFLRQGITDEKELENEVFKFQGSIHEIEKNFFDYIDIDVVNDGSVYDEVEFLDFYRFCDISNEKMIAYLNNRDPYWKTRKSYSIYSTNCPIKQVGDYAHLLGRGFHFYGSPTSWERRLVHLTLKNVKEDLDCRVTRKGYENFTKRIRYELERQVKKEDKLLCAYFVSNKSRSGEELSTPELRNYLSQQLPQYMIPNYFLQLEQIPLTANGKVNRKSLPQPQISRAQSGATFVAPQTGMEKQIAGFWKDVLNLDRVGINDNFFDLGGNSLNIIEVNSKLQEAIGRDIPIVTMFTYPTIRALTLNLKNNGGKEAEPGRESNRSKLINEGKSMMKQVFQKGESVPNL